MSIAKGFMHLHSVDVHFTMSITCSLPTPHTVWHFRAQYGRSAFTDGNSVDVLSYTQYTVQDSVGPRPVLRVKVWPRCSVLSTQYTQYSTHTVYCIIHTDSIHTVHTVHTDSKHSTWPKVVVKMHISRQNITKSHSNRL